VHFLSSFVEPALYQKQGFKHKEKMKKVSGKKIFSRSKRKELYFRIEFL